MQNGIRDAFKKISKMKACSKMIFTSIPTLSLGYFASFIFLGSLSIYYYDWV
jgi:hypothetical protein